MTQKVQCNQCGKLHESGNDLDYIVVNQGGWASGYVVFGEEAERHFCNWECIRDFCQDHEARGGIKPRVKEEGWVDAQEDTSSS